MPDNGTKNNDTNKLITETYASKGQKYLFFGGNEQELRLEQHPLNNALERPIDWDVLNKIQFHNQLSCLAGNDLDDGLFRLKEPYRSQMEFEFAEEIRRAEAEYASVEPQDPSTAPAPADPAATVIDFPALSDERPTNVDVMATLNQVLQVLHQLGENYGKLYATSLPVTDCKGMARILGKSEGTIRRWTEDKVIPAYKLPTGDGKFTYLYNVKRVEEALEDYST